MTRRDALLKEISEILAKKLEKTPSEAKKSKKKSGDSRKSNLTKKGS